jgi:hypothetical protein
MSPHQFWDEDMRLFDVYQKAYYDKLHETAWTNGSYIYNAFSVVYGNVWGGKGKKQKYIEKPINPFEEQDIKRKARRMGENIRVREAAIGRIGVIING